MSRNGEESDPYRSAVCGFSLLFPPPPIIGVFLSFPVMAHIPAWLPIIPFSTFLSAAFFIYFVTT